MALTIDWAFLEIIWTRRLPLPRVSQVDRLIMTDSIDEAFDVIVNHLETRAIYKPPSKTGSRPALPLVPVSPKMASSAPPAPPVADLSI